MLSFDEMLQRGDFYRFNSAVILFIDRISELHVK